MPRPSWDEYFLEVARAIARRSTCISRINGAVVVKDNRIVGTGYNGWASGMRNCSEMFSLPDNPCPRLAQGFRSGEGYGNLCKAIHAEANALLHCRGDTQDATLYLYTESLRQGGELFREGFCLGCLSMMLNKGIRRGVVLSVADGKNIIITYNEADLRNAYLARSR